MLDESVKEVVRGPYFAHLATLNESGSVHISMVWAGLDGDEVVVATMSDQKKLHNMRRDPRVTISFQTDRDNEIGLREYLVIKGRATVTEGGAPELLAELAKTYLGPEAKFPPMPDPPPGFVTRIRVDHLGGVGPWMSK